MDIDRLLNELEDLIDAGSSVPWFGRRYVSEEDFHRLVNAIRHELPRSIAEASEITSERDRLLRQAQEQARKIIDEAHAAASEERREAREQVEQMLSQDSVVQAAAQRAEEITRRAEQEAASIRADTQAWVAALFARIENEVNRMAGTVAQSKAALESQVNQEYASSRPIQPGPEEPGAGE
ncbi:MAG: hypothetical protein GF320_19235 [Armatimonadia bacterium]|nr:hypothetical protein [Armatimonadia bacterium]